MEHRFPIGATRAPLRLFSASAQELACMAWPWLGLAWPRSVASSWRWRCLAASQGGRRPGAQRKVERKHMEARR